MKITSKILSIPPYLSTTWTHISSLSVKPAGKLLTLIVVLDTNMQVEIPALDKETVDTIFDAHAKYADGRAPINPLESPYSFSIPLKSEGSPLEFFNSSMQHNPEQSDLPPLPEDVLKKVTMVAKAFGLEDLTALPDPVLGCNCMYCQITRSLQGYEDSPVEEPVSDEELTFKNWDIEQSGEKLYKVTNRLDKNEHYTVFLGDPLGCTCGEKNCEHIRAVLTT